MATLREILSGIARSIRGDTHGLAEQLSVEKDRRLLIESEIFDLRRQLQLSGWLRLSGRQQSMQPTADEINRLAQNSRAMVINNPLINRAASVQADYIFAQGFSVDAEESAFTDFLSAWKSNPKSVRELFSPIAAWKKEIQLQADGNIFFVVPTTDEATGSSIVRTIPADQVEKIVFNPDDRQEPWLYLRRWNTESGVEKKRYYPDYLYQPAAQPDMIDSIPVVWSAPVFHLSHALFGDWTRGQSQHLQSEPWARAYTQFLEDLSSQWASLAQFSWDYEAKGGSLGLERAHAALNSTFGSTNSETNPTRVPGSAFIRKEGSGKLVPIKTGGATVNADSGRRLLLQVASGAGIPEPFFGDPSTGNLATAKTLDRPTELKMLLRQKLWKSCFQALAQIAIHKSAKAQLGMLRPLVASIDQVGTAQIIRWRTNPETGSPHNPAVLISFPPILERDSEKVVDTIVKAATLDGREPAGTVPPKELARQLLTAIGAEDVDGLLAELDFDDMDERVESVDRRLLSLLRAHTPRNGGSA